MKYLGILESILFAVGSDGITLKELKEVLEIDEERCKKLLSVLQDKYEEEERGIRIAFLAESFKLITKKENKNYLQKLVKVTDNSLLSPASLEVLAIIAYNEPITRIEVDNLRGISSIYTIKKLIARNLIEEAGKSTMPGRPNLYKTTKEFLDYLGLSTISDLPKIEEIINKNQEEDLFTSIYKEEEVEVL